MKSHSDPIVFEPIYQERVWGGRTLETRYGRTLPDPDQPFGESWEIVDRPEAQSMVAAGGDPDYEGMALNELWVHHLDDVFGVGMPDCDRFPILLKILDARDRLSIQVHPPATVADELGGEPKTEMWFIADADPGAELYVGQRKGVDREAFERGIADGTTADLVHVIKPGAGESIFIPSGRLHAIGAGFLIFEIQQNSDTTYRVFDWNRVGLDGTPRDLHVKNSLRSIDFNDIEPEMDTCEDGVLACCDYFHVLRRALQPGTDYFSEVPGSFCILTVTQGRLRCGSKEFSEGDFFLVPAGFEGSCVTVDGPAEVLETSLPAIA